MRDNSFLLAILILTFFSCVRKDDNPFHSCPPPVITKVEQGLFETDKLYIVLDGYCKEHFGELNFIEMAAPYHHYLMNRDSTKCKFITFCRAENYKNTGSDMDRYYSSKSAIIELGYEVDKYKVILSDIFLFNDEGEMERIKIVG